MFFVYFQLRVIANQGMEGGALCDNNRRPRVGKDSGGKLKSVVGSTAAMAAAEPEDGQQKDEDEVADDIDVWEGQEPLTACEPSTHTHTVG